MKQTCILVLGMHRSGTSALTGTLSILDVYLGSDLMKPNKDVNPKGFYENTLLYRVNENLLRQIDSRWDDLFYTEAKLRAEIDTTELERVLRQEFQYSQLFAIKDPRLAYLFPLYAKALTNLGVDIKVVVPVRNPVEVAGSLKTRNQFSQEKGLLLWAYHFLLSEKLSRSYPRVFTSFEALIQDPGKIVELIDGELALNLSSKFNAKKDEIYEFLTPQLKHHNIALDNLSVNVPKVVRDIVNLIPVLNQPGMDRKFDELRAILFGCQSLFYNEEIKKMVQDLERARQDLQEVGRELEQVNQHFLEKNEELEKAQHTLCEVQKALELTERRLQENCVELERTQSCLQQKDIEINKIGQDLKELSADLETTTSKLHASEAHLEISAKTLQEKEAELDQLKLIVKGKDKELDQSKHKLKQKDVEINHVRRGLQSKVEELTLVRKRLDLCGVKLEQTEQELVSLYMSTSWKVTRFLRKAKRLIRF